MTELSPKEKVCNIGYVIEDIKKFPQTYNTILKEEQYNKTTDFILRRKMSKLCKQGDVYKTTIPGTRFGKVLFYSMPKKYHILAEASRTSGSTLYTFFEYKKLSQFYIKLIEYWTLEKEGWVKGEKEKVIFDGNILKWI